MLHNWKSFIETIYSKIMRFKQCSTFYYTKIYGCIIIQLNLYLLLYSVSHSKVNISLAKYKQSKLNWLNIGKCSFCLFLQTFRSVIGHMCFHMWMCVYLEWKHSISYVSSISKGEKLKWKSYNFLFKPNTHHDPWIY